MKKLLYLLIAFLFLTASSVNADVIGGRFYPITPSVDVQKAITNLNGHLDHKINVVFSDIDGTIIPFNDKSPKFYVPASAKTAAQKLKDAGIPLFLVTGRSASDGREYAKQLGYPTTYVISQQGAEITDSMGKTIYQDSINNKDAVNIISEVENLSKDNKLDLRIFVYTNGNLYMTDDLGIPYINDKITVLKSFSELPQNYTPVKIGIYNCNTANLQFAQTYLKKKFKSYNIVISAHCYCDISQKTSTKGNAVEKLAKILNIDLKSTAVFGDAENDISMLSLIRKHKGAAIAVGNAMPSVKDKANYITLPALQDGFAKGVDEILKNNDRLK